MPNPFAPTRPRPASSTAQPAMPAATARSLSYMRDLMLEKAQVMGMDMAAAEQSVDAWIAKGISQRVCSDQIDKLKAMGLTGRRKKQAPTAAPTRTELPGLDVVPEGRYAIPTQDGAINELAFYKVDRPTTGQWAGNTYIRRLVGPDEQRVPRNQEAAILAKIAEIGAEEASATYGKEIGRCGICHTRLTNDESRARGIGPKCAEKHGW